MWSLFGLWQTAKDPRELAREWTLVLRKENRQLDRQIRAIEFEAQKTKQSLKASFSKGERDACRVLAREIVRAQKAVGRIYTAKAKLKSVECHITEQMSMVRISGALQMSADVMKTMQELVQVSDVTESMRELSKEMMKAGVIEEMVDEMFIEVEDDMNLEEEAQTEVEKVLWDLTAGELGRAPDVVTDPLPDPPSTEPETVAMETEAEDEEGKTMNARLKALRS